MTETGLGDYHRVFRRTRGGGWLALAGDLEGVSDSLDLLGEKMLVHADFSRAPRLILGSEADRASVASFRHSFERWLGSPIQSDGLGHQPVETWLGSGLMVLAGGPWRDWVQALSSSSGDALLPEQSLLCAVGAAAEAVGRWVFQGGEVEPGTGLGWLPDAIVLAGREDAAAPAAVRTLLAREIYSYAIVLPHEAVLALGPAGEVEVWGQRAPTVVLGAGWRQA